MYFGWQFSVVIENWFSSCRLVRHLLHLRQYKIMTPLLQIGRRPFMFSKLLFWNVLGFFFCTQSQTPTPYIPLTSSINSQSAIGEIVRASVCTRPDHTTSQIFWSQFKLRAHTSFTTLFRMPVANWALTRFNQIGRIIHQLNQIGYNFQRGVPCGKLAPSQ